MEKNWEPWVKKKQIYDQLIYDKEAKHVKWNKENLRKQRKLDRHM